MRASGTVTMPWSSISLRLLRLKCPVPTYLVNGGDCKGIWYAYALAFVSLCIVMQGLYYQFVWKKRPLKRSFKAKQIFDRTWF